MATSKTPPPAQRRPDPPAPIDQSAAPNTAIALIKHYERAVRCLLPDGYKVGTLQALIQKAFWQKPKLKLCNPLSVLGAAMEAAKLGLEPNTVAQHCFLIPYGSECQFQMGYQGLQHLVRREGQVGDIEPTLVYRNEPFEFYRHPETHRWVVEHKPILDGSDRGEWVGGYSIAFMRDGSPSSVRPHTQEYLDKVRAFALDKQKNAPKQDELPWNAWPEQQFLKTMIKRHCKTLPMPDPVRVAIERDNEAEANTQDTAALIRQIIQEKTAIDTTAEVEDAGQELAELAATPDAAPEDSQAAPPGMPPGDEGVLAEVVK